MTSPVHLLDLLISREVYPEFESARCGEDLVFPRDPTCAQIPHSLWLCQYWLHQQHATPLSSEWRPQVGHCADSGGGNIRTGCGLSLEELWVPGGRPPVHACVGVMCVLQVKLLEASGRIGGRVKDDFSLGPCIGLGAMFITGINNNPLMLLTRQLGLSLRHTNEDCCELISEDGWRPESAVDKRVEAHFNRALDKLAEWRKSYSDEDVSLGGEAIWVWQ